MPFVLWAGEHWSQGVLMNKKIIKITAEALTSKRSPRKFEKVVVTTAVHLRELVLVNDQIAKQNIKNP